MHKVMNNVQIRVRCKRVKKIPIIIAKIWGRSGAVIAQLIATPTVIGSIHSKVQKKFVWFYAIVFPCCRPIASSDFQLGPTPLRAKTAYVSS